VALRDADNLFGPRQVISMAMRQVRAIQEDQRAVRGAELRELLHVQTQFGDLLGWLHQDIREFKTSQYWMDRALEWAHAAGDPDSVAFVLARKSQLAGDMADPTESVAVAHAAMNLAPPRSLLRAIAATYGARGYALGGDQATCQQLYDQARSSLDRSEPDGTRWWGSFFDEPYIALHQARSFAVLGDHRRATEEFAAIRRVRDGYRRDRGVYLAWEAGAYAGLGEPAEAAKIGMQALAVGTETGSQRILAELASLDGRLADRTLPEVAEFHIAVTEAIRQMPDVAGGAR
jgi:hypothetical protein